MKKYLLLFGLLYTGFFYAQLFDYSKDFNITRNYRPWGISLSGNLYPFYSQNDLNSGDLINRTHLMWGFSFGLVYNWTWTNHFGMKFRLKAEKMSVYKYKLFIPASETSDGKNFYDNIGSYAPFSIHLPVTLEYRNFLIENYTLHFQAGMDIAYHWGFNQLKDHNNYLTSTFANPPRFVYDLYFVAGWYYEFPWALWETGVVYRHTLKDYYNGVYTVGNLKNSPDEIGRISQSGKYIGLEFTVYFKKPYVDNARCAGQVHSKKVLKRRRLEEKAREKARKAEEKAKKKEIKRNKRRTKKKKKFIIF